MWVYSISDCYALACNSCHVSLWIGQEGSVQGFYVYTTEPETSNLSKFLKAHQSHLLVFDNTQEFFYGFNGVDEKFLAHDCGVKRDPDDPCYVGSE